MFGTGWPCSWNRKDFFLQKSSFWTQWLLGDPNYDAKRRFSANRSTKCLGQNNSTSTLPLGVACSSATWISKSHWLPKAIQVLLVTIRTDDHRNPLPYTSPQQVSHNHEQSWVELLHENELSFNLKHSSLKRIEVNSTHCKRSKIP